MSEIYLWLKWAHVVSSTVLFGMGAGIASGPAWANSTRARKSSSKGVS